MIPTVLDEDDLRDGPSGPVGVFSKKFFLLGLFMLSSSFAGSWYQDGSSFLLGGVFVAHAQSETLQKNACLLKGDFLRSSGQEKTMSWHDECAPLAANAPEPKTRNDIEEKMSVEASSYPIGAMIPLMAEHDHTVAAFLFGIAKKESDWGVHAPKRNGQDCYNYWGYKGSGGNGSVSGYACFGSSEEALNIVGGRISELVHDRHLDTPRKMLVWKCGSSCEGFDAIDNDRWVRSLEMYYDSLLGAGDR